MSLKREKRGKELEIKVQDLTKKYTREVMALNILQTELETGVTGLLGPNGSGKSTFIKLLTGLEKATTGQIDYFLGAENRKSLKAYLGYVPQNFSLPENLTGAEFLNFMIAAKSLDYRPAQKYAKKLLALLNLTAVAKRKIGTYSGGMKQRLGIAQALLNKPKVLILDEPTVGLDPDERLNLKNLITELAESTLILLSTHIVSDVESLANNIILLNHGEVQAQGSIEHLIECVKGNVWELSIAPEAFQKLQSNYRISETQRQGKMLKVRIIAATKPENAQLVQPSLEDVYLFYTHHEMAAQKQPVML